MVWVIIREPVIGSAKGVEYVLAVEGKGLAGELGLTNPEIWNAKWKFDYRRNEDVLTEIVNELNLDQKRLKQACYEKLWREQGLRNCLSQKWMQDDLSITDEEMAAMAPELDKLQADMEVELRKSSGAQRWNHEHWHTIRLKYEPKMFEMLSDEAQEKAIEIFGLDKKACLISVKHAY